MSHGTKTQMHGSHSTTNDEGLAARVGTGGFSRVALLFAVVVLVSASLVAGCAGDQSKKDQKPTEATSKKQDDKTGEQADSPASDASTKDDEGTQRQPGEATTDKQQEETSKSGGGLFGGGGGGDLSSVVEKADPGRPNETIQAFRKFTDDEKNGYIAHYNIGVMYEIKGQMGSAVDAYKKALSKNPDFTPALHNIVLIHLRDGDVTEASSVTQQYIDERPDNIDHRTVQLEVMLHKGQYQDTVRRAKALLRRDEKNVRAMIALARANYWMERYELSKAVLERAVDVDDDRADIYHLFGLIAVQNEDDPRARANFEKAIELQPRFAAARNNLGLLYHEATDYDAARQQFEKATEYLPTFKEAYLNLGNAYKGLKKFEKAKQAFERAIELDQQYADAYFNLGILYMDSKIGGMEKIPRLQKAIEYLNEYKRVAKRIESDDPVDDYISEAREKIKVERQRQKMLRQQQKGGGGSGGNSSGSSGDQSSSGNDSGGSSN